MSKVKTYCFGEITIGQKVTFSKQITDQDMAYFSEISGDINPLHTNESFAKTTEFKRPVAYGMLASILHSTLSGVHLPGKYSILVSEESRFIKPFYPGDELIVFGEVYDKKEFGNLIYIKTEIRNKESIVIKGKIISQVLK